MAVSSSEECLAPTAVTKLFPDSGEQEKPGSSAQAPVPPLLATVVGRREWRKPRTPAPFTLCRTSSYLDHKNASQIADRGADGHTIKAALSAVPDPRLPSGLLPRTPLVRCLLPPPMSGPQARPLGRQRTTPCRSSALSFEHTPHAPSFSPTPQIPHPLHPCRHHDGGEAEGLGR